MVGGVAAEGDGHVVVVGVVARRTDLSGETCECRTVHLRQGSSTDRYLHEVHLRLGVEVHYLLSVVLKKKMCER